MGKYEYFYINKDSVLYKKVIEIRYRIFLKPFNCPVEIVYDDMEDCGIHLVCSYNNYVVGYGRLNLDDKVAWISQLVIKEEHRMKGIGYNIVKKLIDRSKELGMEKSILNARIEAVGLYYKLGYEIVGREFYSRKTGLPHVRMEKVLKDI